MGFPFRTPGLVPALHVLLIQGVQQPAWRDMHFPLGPPPAPTGADSRGRGLWPDAQPYQEAHSPLLLQISTFSNLTFLSNETGRFGTLHIRLLCLALSGFKHRPAYMCIMLDSHIVFFQPRLKYCFNGCFFQQILPKKTKFIPFSNMWLPWSSLLELRIQSCPHTPGRTVNCIGMRIYLE